MKFAEPPPELLAGLASALQTDGYFITTEFLSLDQLLLLKKEFVALRSEGSFRRASVGRANESSLRDEIRRDEIHWFEEGHLRPAQQALWNTLLKLMGTLNETLYASLTNLEGHFAYYSVGGFYLRHMDCFRGDDRRWMSCVLYLNKRWRAGDGGELKLYVTENGAEKTVTVEPRLGTFVCFLSAEIEHEVMPARTERASFAGWMKRR